MRPIFFILMFFLAFTSCNEVSLSTVELKQKFGQFGNDSLNYLAIDYSAAPVSKTIQHNLEEYNFINNINAQKIAFMSNGEFLTGSIVSPKVKGKYPCIILNHDINSKENQEINIDATVNMLAPLAEKGYTVVAFNPSGTGGSEGQYNPATHSKHLKNLINIISSIESVDSSKIALLGLNSGTYINYLSMSKEHNIKAAINISGLLNLQTNLNPVLAFYKQNLSSESSDVGLATTSYNSVPILNLSYQNQLEYDSKTSQFYNLASNNSPKQTPTHFISNRDVYETNSTQVIDLIHYWFLEKMIVNKNIAHLPLK